MFQFVSRVIKLMTVLKVANKPFTAVFKKGFSVASTEISHNLKSHCPQLNTIIDVGANKGQFALAISTEYPVANVYSFEPLPDEYLALQKNCKDQKKCKTFNVALGSSNGQIEFYKTGYSLASSALKPTAFHINNTDYSTEVSSIQVPVRRLDEMGTSIDYVTPVLLKLDVQGFEKEVIKGASTILDKIDFILIEVSFVQMYENEPLFIEMHNFLSTLGFSVVAPLSTFQNSSLQVLQLDFLYKKSK